MTTEYSYIGRDPNSEAIDLSDDVNSDRSDVGASSKAVKTVNDKAVATETKITQIDQKITEVESSVTSIENNVETIINTAGGGAAALEISEDKVLTADDPRTLLITATEPGLTIVLPDASTIEADGVAYRIAVQGKNSIMVKNQAGIPIGQDSYGTLSVGMARIFILIDKTSKIWMSLDANINEIVTDSTTGLYSSITGYIFESTKLSNFNHALRLSDNEILVSYIHRNGSYPSLYCKKLTFSGDSVNMSSKVTIFSSNTTNGISSNITTCLLKDNKVLITYHKNEAKNIMYAKILTIDGNAIYTSKEYGPLVTAKEVTATNGLMEVNLITLSENLVFISFGVWGGGHSVYPKCFIIKVDYNDGGDEITVGNVLSIDNILRSSSVYPYMISNDSVLLYHYSHDSDGTQNRATKATISFPNISLSNWIDVTEIYGENSVSYKIGNKMLIFNSGYGLYRYKTIDISGEDIVDMGDTNLEFNDIVLGFYDQIFVGETLFLLGVTTSFSEDNDTRRTAIVTFKYVNGNYVQDRVLDMYSDIGGGYLSAISNNEAVIVNMQPGTYYGMLHKVYMVN